MINEIVISLKMSFSYQVAHAQQEYYQEENKLIRNVNLITRLVVLMLDVRSLLLCYF